MIDYYALIGSGVGPATPEAELRTALFAAARLWKNRETSRQLEKRQEAERNSAYLLEAQKALLDPTRRAEYNKKLATAPRDTAPAHQEDVPTGNLIETGWRYLADGNIPEALHVATRATEQQGNNPDAWALLAQAKFRWGDTEDAIYEYKRAIRLKPNDASYYFDLGNVYESHNSYGDALQQYGRAAQIDPGTPMYRAAQGTVLVKNEHYDEGIQILEQCIKEDPNNSGFQWFLAAAYVDSCQLGWTYVPSDNALHLPSGYYATTREHVVHAQRLLAKAETLKFDDQELSSHIRAVRQDIDSMMERKFQGSVAVPIVGGLIWSLFYGIGILFAIGYFVASRPPRYAINKYVLKGGLGTADSAAFAEGVKSGLFASALYGLFLPIMVVVNFIRYYTGDNSTPSAPVAAPA